MEEIIEIMSDMLNLLVMLKSLKQRSRKKRSCAVRRLNKNRKIHGYFAVTFLKMKKEDPDQFFVHTRMTINIYNLLLSLVHDGLVKTSMAEPISPECRLAVTLTYLALGTPVQAIAWSYKLGKETVRKIILETCDIIWANLFPIYVSEPKENDLHQISQDFMNLWQLPNCIGAIDGKHIAIRCPPNACAQYFNYKHYNSIVLLAASDAKYVFTYIDVGAYGSQSDGGIFRASSFGKRILSDSLPFPKDSPLPGTNEKLPHFFVADAAFPLTRNIMKLFPG